LPDVLLRADHWRTFHVTAARPPVAAVSRSAGYVIECRQVIRSDLNETRSCDKKFNKRLRQRAPRRCPPNFVGICAARRASVRCLPGDWPSRCVTVANRRKVRPQEPSGRRMRRILPFCRHL